MKKFLFVLAFLLLGGTVFFTYQKWTSDENLSAWSFVPSNTLLAYETSSLLSVYEAVSQTELWKNFSALSKLKSLQNTISLLDTLNGENNFRNHFDKNHFVSSLQKISSEQFDFLHILEINSLTQHTYISKALSAFKNAGYTVKTRTYLDFTITDMWKSDQNEVFTYIYYQNYFVCSFSAFLVEDAIRSVSNPDVKNFNQQNPELAGLTKLQLDEGNIYLNLESLDAFLGAFLAKPSNIDLAKSAYLDLKVQNKTLNLSGFSFIDEPTNFLSVFQDNNAGSFLISEIVPDNTAYLEHISVSSPEKLSKQLSQYFQIHDPQVLAAREKILEKVDFDVDYTFQLVDNEISVVTLETKRESQLDRLLILQIKDMGEALKYFNSVDERRSISNADTIFLEQFGQYEIRQLPAENFGYALLGEMGNGFNQSYYLTYRNYIVFSNNLQRLKTLTFSIEDENTWNKTIETNNFLSLTDQAANYSLFVSIPRVWKQLLPKLKASWIDHLEKFSYTYKNLQYASIQFSRVDNKYYTNVTLHQPELPESKLPTDISTIEALTLGDYIKTKPYLVTNHNTKAKEILVQDSAYNLYLLSERFESLWSKPIGDKISSPIYQVDYYKNNKLQYLFATERSIHIIDRNGDYIAGFPKGLPENAAIQFLSLIDYKNTKDYRFGISDYQGNQYLMSKDLKGLGDWNPKKFPSNIATPLRHFRIGSSDFMITLLEDGKLYVKNRKGFNRDGFPLDFGVSTSDYFVKTANNIRESSIVLVTAVGELIEIAMDSRLISRDQIYKPAVQTEFTLIPDVANESFIILRKTENKYEFLDEKGALLFAKDYFASQPISVQYYKLGSDNNYIVIVDPDGSYLYIYDLGGNLITGRPLAASQPISIMKFGKELRVYRALDRNVDLMSIKF